MKYGLALFFSFVLQISFAQDIEYARRIIKVLSSPEFHGRGYVSNGDQKAAAFIRRELNRAGLKSFDGITFFQPFEISANTFPNDVVLQADTSSLALGRDFVVMPSSNACAGTFPVVRFDRKVYRDSAAFINFFRTDHSEEFIVMDFIDEEEKHVKEIMEGLFQSNSFAAAGIILLVEKAPIFTSSTFVNDFCSFKVKKEAWPDNADSVTVEVSNEFRPTYSTNNVLGYLKGETDSTVLITAHYDHVGRIGPRVYFPGANDNASGTAMLINMASYFGKSKNKLRHNLVFIAFGGEESGLLGSKYFVEHPLVNLKKVKMVLNLDMVGSGDEGITVVNGTIFRDDYLRLEELNTKLKLLPEVKPRGEAANSDHYPFYAHGVKSFFVYTRGKYKEYHNVSDSNENLPLNEYEDLFKLLVRWVESY